MTEENKKLNVGHAVDKGEGDLDSARALLQTGHYDNAVVLAYYGAFHFARALLITADLQPRTHEGMMRMFSLHFVQSGRFCPSSARALSILEAERLRASYDSTAVFSEAMARESLLQAQSLASEVRAYLEQEGYL